MVPQRPGQEGRKAAGGEGVIRPGLPLLGNTLSLDNTIDLVFRLQMLWNGMHGRCNLPSHRSYKDYGAKGITLSPEWSHHRGCIKFVKWAVANGYQQGLDIDRIINTEGYSPGNCRFITRQQNCWNKSNNLMLTYGKETKCSAEWGSDPRCVVHTEQFQQRIACGWSIERALFTPLRRRPSAKTRKA